MKIEIKNEDQKIILDDDDLDNDNFVDISIIEKYKEPYEGMVITVPIEDLCVAVQAFLKKRELNDERERKYTN